MVGGVVMKGVCLACVVRVMVGWWSGVVGLVCPVFCCGPRSMITYVVLMSSFHVALLSSCHVLCWWLSSCRGRHVGVV